MEKIRRILATVDFTDFSHDVTERAVIMAKALNAGLTFIHVVESNWDKFQVIPETQSVFPTLLEIEKAVEKKMHELKNEIAKKFNLVPDIHITTGRIYEEIINFSRERDFDLIVMAAHGVSGFKDFFIGTNAQRVVTLSEIPVLTMQNGIKSDGFKKILIPIDNSIHSREKVTIARLIAELYGSEIHIVGLPGTDDEHELNKFNLKIKTVEKIIREGDLKYKSKVIDGDNLADVAIDYATDNHCDLIVINTGHESRHTGIFLGAFAQQIVNRSKIPVLSIKHKHGYYVIDTPGFGIS